MQVNTGIGSAGPILPHPTNDTAHLPVNGDPKQVAPLTRDAVTAAAGSDGSNQSANVLQKQQQQQQQQQQPLDQAALKKTVDKLNETANFFNANLQFTTDDDTGKQVVKVVDKSTNQVIRQIPSEEVLRLSKAIDDFKGLLVKDTA